MTDVLLAIIACTISLCALRLTQIYMRLKAVTHVPEIKKRRAGKPESDTSVKRARVRSPRKKKEETPLTPMATEMVKGLFGEPVKLPAQSNG
jgi:hypothetical protein